MIFRDTPPKPLPAGSIMERIARTLIHRRDWMTGAELFEAIQPCTSEGSMRVLIKSMRARGWPIEAERGLGSRGYRLIEPELPSFVLRRWLVRVLGHDDAAEVYAVSQLAAMAEVWRCGAFDGMKWGDFCKRARCTMTPAQPEPAKIQVGGRDAWWIKTDAQYVHFVRPYGRSVLKAHPYDVQPAQYRPEAYRERAACPV